MRQGLIKALCAYDKDVHPVGESLPTDQRVFRVKVVSTFFKAGVPLNKMDMYRDILEEGGDYRLARRHRKSKTTPTGKGREI